MAWNVPASATPSERLALIERAIADPSTPRAIAPIVRAIRSSNAGSRAIATAALSFVQGLEFRPEPPGEDYYLTPAETLDAAGGDCEDLVALLVSILRAAGVQAWPVYIPQPSAPWDHISAGVRVEQKTLWADPSVRGARLGEPPQDAARRLGSLALAV